MARRQFLGRNNEVDIRQIPDGTWLDCVPDDAYEPKSSTRPSEALNANRQAIRRIVAAGGGRNPRVFGSALTGKDTLYSDLDLLADYVPGSGAFRFCGIAGDLEELLGVAVDLHTPNSLPRHSRQQILSEAQPV